MAAWRRAIELSLGETDLEKLRMIARSRTEAASRVERAPMLAATLPCPEPGCAFGGGNRSPRSVVPENVLLDALQADHLEATLADAAHAGCAGRTRDGYAG
jgi:hypothetical protein